MICWHKLYHFMVANTGFTSTRQRSGKTKFATIKWYNLCQQIIQSQTCYPLIFSWRRDKLSREFKIVSFPVSLLLSELFININECKCILECIHCLYFALSYSLCFSPTAIGGALSRDQKLSDHIHWKWAFSLNTSTAKSFASAFPVNMESAPK